MQSSNLSFLVMFIIMVSSILIFCYLYTNYFGQNEQKINNLYLCVEVIASVGYTLWVQETSMKRSENGRGHVMNFSMVKKSRRDGTEDCRLTGGHGTPFEGRYSICVNKISNWLKLKMIWLLSASY